MKKAAHYENQLAEILDETGQMVLAKLIESQHEIDSITALGNFIPALDRAVLDGLVRINPAADCKLPSQNTKEMQRFLIQAKEKGYFELFLLELAKFFGRLQ